MIQGALFLLWLALLVAGDTPVGRRLRAALVEAPARWLNRWSRGDVLLILLLLAGAAAILWLMEAEGRLFLSMVAPDVLAGASMLELGTLLDAAVTATAVFTTLRIRGLRLWLTARFARRLPRSRRARPQRRCPANDDGDGPALTCAA
ncbi:hypothetical protein [Sphingomonas sp.]|uniref:hypothetical protein n=1 Tax=Sphingomonas sp. TaxID=28214 RepID=UPI002FD8BAA5